MPLEIPYTFVAGTKAKSLEVNSNFQSVKQFVDQNETNLAQAQLDITNLQNNKANIGGAIENTFKVANPSNEYDAVNLQYFKTNISNMQGYINGFVLSKYDNTTISATPGSCWDSTYEYMFVSSTSLQVSQSNLGQNATYYIYITGGPSISNQLVISLSNTTPELPEDATLFRLLGSFVTDDEGNIKDTFSNSNSVSLSDIQNIVNGSMPDYKSAEVKTTNTTYTADTAGYISVQTGQNNDATVSVTIDGFLAYYCKQWKYVQAQRIMVPVGSGSKYSVTGSNVQNVYWIPCIGG